MSSPWSNSAQRPAGAEHPTDTQRSAGAPAPAGSLLLEVERARWGYPAGREVFYPAPPVSFAVCGGDLVMLTGENGSGKTTLLRGLLGLLDDHEGDVHWHLSREEVGYIPQESAIDHSLPATVLDIVRTGRPRDWAHGRQAALYALEEVGLADRHGAPFSRLSGGQRQRVLVARALTGRPRMLLLDEPTVNVDAPTARRLGELLGRLAAEGLGIVVTSHVTTWIPAAREVAL